MLTSPDVRPPPHAVKAIKPPSKSILCILRPADFATPPRFPNVSRKLANIMQGGRSGCNSIARQAQDVIYGKFKSVPSIMIRASPKHFVVYIIVDIKI